MIFFNFKIGVFLFANLNTKFGLFFYVSIYTNSLEVIKAMKVNQLKSSPSTLVRRIHVSLQIIDQWCFKHILRNKNKVDNRFAKMTSYKSIEV